MKSPKEKRPFRVKGMRPCDLQSEKDKREEQQNFEDAVRKMVRNHYSRLELPDAHSRSADTDPTE